MTYPKEMTVRLFLLLVMLSATLLADSASVTPKPRKRLHRDGQGTATDTSKEPSVIGSIQETERQYMNMVRHCILTDYNRLTRGLSDAPDITSQCKLQLRIDTKTSRAQVVKIIGDMSDRRRALLRSCVDHVAEFIACPREVASKYGPFFEFEFTMSFVVKG